MSYTLTIDAPEVASYVTRRGVGFREEFNALLVAYVQTRMAFDVPAPRSARRPGGLRGRIRIASDFDDESAEIADLFEHSSI